MGFAFRMQGSRAKRGGTPTISPIFTNVDGQALNSVITSNTVTTGGGFPGSSAISVADAGGEGGTVEYRVNSGSWTSSPATLDPTDTVTLRLTTHALWLGDLNIVILTIAGTAFEWTVETLQSAPALANPVITFFDAAQYASTAGSPSHINIATSYNITNSNTTFVNGVTDNYAVFAGTTNTAQWPAGSQLGTLVSGTYTNHMYHPGRYDMAMKLYIHCGASVDVGAGNDNALCNLQAVASAGWGGRGPPDRDFVVIGTDVWNPWGPANSNITSNSQSADIYWGTIDSDHISIPNSLSLQPFPAMAANVMEHSGHPGPTSPGSAGAAGNYLQMQLLVSVQIIDTLDGSIVHTVHHIDGDLQILPA